MLKVSSIGFLFLLSGLQSIICEDEWRFINLADFHGAEEFVLDPLMDWKDFKKMDGKAAKKFDAVQAIHEDYGGELVIIPGDTNSGKWFEDRYIDLLNVKNHKKAVKKAGKRCYESLKYFFQKAGYDKLLVAIGDHELGGNAWPKDKLKTNLVSNLRKIFTDTLNKDEEGNWIYDTPIGSFSPADSRPIGTPFAGTSYAHQHKNVLFVTVDAFKSKPEDYLNRVKGEGGEGSITCDVSGKHLVWFEKVLKKGRNDPSIDHIIVQAHLPILQPVRKAYCSGQYMDGADESEFWLTMREYEVDVYFAGEVHTNTATKDEASNLVQVVSRGNGASNFLTIDVTDTALSITSYKEVGKKSKFNGKYVEQGSLVIDKSGAKTKIQSEGNLELLNRAKPMIRLTFDEIGLLQDRPLTVLHHDNDKETSLQSVVTIRGVECSESFINYGAYGQDYDAIAANVQLKNDAKSGKSAFLEKGNARIAIDGLGPHSGGEPVSYAMWFKTQMDNAYLIHFGLMFGGGDGEYKNPIFSVILEQGRPTVHISDSTKLVLRDETINLSRKVWHHVAISMPYKSCLLSEVEVYIDGKKFKTKVEGTDQNLFFHPAGRVSVGGLGRSGSNMENILPDARNFRGHIDEVYVWGRPIFQRDVDRAMGN